MNSLDDLETGMLVEIEDNQWAIVLRYKDADCFVSDGSERKRRFWGPFCDYRWDEIKRVYSYSNNKNAVNFSTIERNLLYEKKEIIELSMDQIAEKFEVDVKDLKIKKGD